MKKILVVGYGSTDSMERSTISLPLRGIGYKVDTLQDTLLTEEKGRQYDLIFAQRMHYNINILKALLDSGVPVVASVSYNNSTNTQLSLGMFSSEKADSTYSNMFDFIDDSSVIFSQFKYKSINSSRIAFSVSTAEKMDFFLSEKMAKSGVTVASKSLNEKNKVVISCFPKGGEDCFGNKFSANCAFWGCSNIAGYKNIFELLNGLIDWCFGTVEISGDVVSSDNGPLSREVIFYPKNRQGVGYKTTSNKSGKFTIELPAGYEYFGVAFDEDGGDKNAVIIDRIKV